MSEDKATPQLDFEQRQRAALIAESRGIDDDTAHELVWLRDSHNALVAALKQMMDWIGPPPVDRMSFDSLREDAWKAARAVLTTAQGEK